MQKRPFTAATAQRVPALDQPHCLISELLPAQVALTLRQLGLGLRTCCFLSRRSCGLLVFVAFLV